MTFLNPLLLIASIGISLPILAHLFNRHKVKHTDWAAMQFLSRSVRVRSRQLRLRDLLLLVLRCLAVLLLVLALSRPATNSTDGIGLPGEERAGVVIALDASYSMAHSDDKRTRFERAIERIGVISEHLRPGDPVTLVLLGGEHRVVLRNVAYEPDRFAQVLQEQQKLHQQWERQMEPQLAQPKQHQWWADCWALQRRSLPGACGRPRSRCS